MILRLLFATLAVDAVLVLIEIVRYKRSHLNFKSFLEYDCAATSFFFVQFMVLAFVAVAILFGWIIDGHQALEEAWSFILKN